MKIIQLFLLVSLFYSCDDVATDDEVEVIKDSLSSENKPDLTSHHSDEETSKKLSTGTQGHIFLNYTGNQKQIADAVTKANEILNNDEFYKAIEKSKSFDSTKVTPAEIASLMRNARIDINIKTYYYLNPLHPKRCVNANTPSSGLIKINTRCFDDILSDAVNTLVHECVHAVDLLDDELDFTHWSNNNSDGSQDKTAPWVIGAIAEEMVKNGK